MKYFFIVTAMLFSGRVNSQNQFDIEGHRGCRGLYPENTIVAFKEAVKLGANSIELDVMVSKDGQLLVSHDPHLNPAICNAPNGLPVTAATKKNYTLYHMEYSEIEKCDCGSRGNPKFPEQRKMAAYKPLLRDVIDSVENYIHTNHLPEIHYNIEIKSAPSGDNRLHPMPTVIAKMLYDLVKQKDILSHCTIQSFDVRSLQVIKKIDSTVRIGLLIANFKTFEKNLKRLGFTPTTYSPIYLLVSRKLIRKCHAKNVRIVPWTVESEKKMIKLKAMGVDGIITDYPNRAIKVLR